MPETSVSSRFLARCKTLIPENSAVLAAVSGGGDSTALLCMLHEGQKRLGIRRLGVAHVDHGLRGSESDGDRLFVADLACRLNLHFFLKKLTGRTPGEAGIEEWARQERYLFFKEIKEREGFDVVATGHSADDQAETVLMRLLRGSGLRGMRGILPRRDDGVVRPLLDLRRMEIEGWLRERSIGFRTDASNADLSLGRNRIRHEILPMLEERESGAGLGLFRIAALSGELWERMQPAVDRWVSEHVTGNGVRFTIDRAAFGDGLHAVEGLARVFEHYGIPIESHHLEEVLAASDRTDGEFLLPGGSWRYYPRRHGILFIDHRAGAPQEFSYHIALKGVTECPTAGVRFDARETTLSGALPRDNLTVALDRDKIGKELIFRSMQPGDRFQPLGASGPMDAAAFLAKQGVSRVERPLYGVVGSGDGTILWIPGIRIGQTARITSRTEHRLRLSYQSYSCPII